jgi:hypothetical protein
MGNLFDSLQDAAHTVVANTMGYTASWTPSTGGGPTQTATVLFNKPTQKADITDEEFQDITPKMEYLDGDFVGLDDAVNSNKTEIITIAGIDYVGYKVDRKYDGKTIIIHIQIAE